MDSRTSKTEELQNLQLFAVLTFGINKKGTWALPSHVPFLAIKEEASDCRPLLQSIFSLLFHHPALLKLNPSFFSVFKMLPDIFSGALKNSSPPSSLK
jgi:hypothetical protein